MDAIRSIQACEKAGFQIVDVLTTWAFEHTRRRIPEYGNQHIIREYQPGDADVLLPLAREVYNRTPDRFHCDPYLPKHLSSDLYAEWFRNSCTGQLADHIVVAEFDGKPAGFITLKIGDDHNLLPNVRTGGIMLIATAPWASGKGICTSMLISSLKWLESQGVEVSHVGTQVNNYYVQRACAGIGFRPVKSGPSMHLWLHK
jgi:RimJ/RimL family protein N-acetyltransferase